MRLELNSRLLKACSPFFLRLYCYRAQQDILNTCNSQILGLLLCTGHTSRQSESSCFDLNVEQSWRAFINLN